MLRLDTTTRSLEIQLAGAVTTNQLPVVVCYSDQTASSYNGNTQLANTNNTTVVTICAAPGASTNRDIDYLSVWNRDTAPATVIITLNDNSTLYIVARITLAVGEQLTYTHGEGWRCATTSGQLKVTTGGAGSVALDDLTDVIITAPATGAVLTYNGTDWIDGQVDLADTDAVTGTLAIGNGGTGLSSTPTNGQLLIGNGTGYTLSTTTPGPGISITNGAGSITINNTGVLSFSAGTTGLTPSSPTTGAITLAGTLIAANGGTGFSSYAVGDLLYADTTSTLAKLADVATGNALISGGVGVAPSWGKIDLTTHVVGDLPYSNLAQGSALSVLGVAGNAVADNASIVAGADFNILRRSGTTVGFGSIDLSQAGAVGASVLGATNGGTGQSTVTTGDLLYGSAANTWSKLADVATGNALISGGVGVAPLWGKIGLTTHVSGILPIANGGTNTSTTPTNGQLLIGNGTDYTVAALTAGTNISITNGAGSITINNTKVFGDSYQYAASEGTSTTTSTIFQNKTTMTTPSLPAGTYRVGWMYEWNHTDTTTNFHGRVQLNNTTDFMEHEEEPQDGGPEQWHEVSGFIHTALSGVNTIDLDWSREGASGTAGIRRARLEIWRVS